MVKFPIIYRIKFMLHCLLLNVFHNFVLIYLFKYMYGPIIMKPTLKQANLRKKICHSVEIKNRVLLNNRKELLKDVDFKNPYLIIKFRCGKGLINRAITHLG